jgi:hypothetical protein
MYPTIILGLAILLSVLFVWDMIAIMIAVYYTGKQAFEALVCLIAAIVLWCWLYYLSH